MKKIARFVAVAAFVLASLTVYAQNRVFAPAFRTCVSGDTRVELSNGYIEMDTDFGESGMLLFTVFGDFGPTDYAFPVTKVEERGDAVLYRCNPMGSKEEALLIVYSDTLHYNEYSEGDNRCVEYTERYCVLRKRTPYGYLEYRFAI